MKIAYISKSFRPSSVQVIEQANEIVDDYMAQGLSLTLRQLYYRFVASGLLPNTQAEYKRLGGIVNDGRLAGLIDWSAIEDRTRNIVENGHWAGPARILDSCVTGYARDKWEDQPCRVEVWIEKEALAGVFEPVCRELDVPLFACRGYTSQSEMWAAGQRLLTYMHAKQKPVVLHFGDHDPSGIDMTRDVQERLELFTAARLDLQRIALNMDQVDAYGPPPNPAKVTDSRFASYVEVHGSESWELDALDPSVLAGLIRQHVKAHRDQVRWDDACRRETHEREALARVRDQFDAEDQS